MILYSKAFYIFKPPYIVHCYLLSVVAEVSIKLDHLDCDYYLNQLKLNIF